MLAIPVCGVGVPKHKDHKFKASFGHVLRIKKEKNPTNTGAVCAFMEELP